MALAEAIEGERRLRFVAVLRDGLDDQERAEAAALLAASQSATFYQSPDWPCFAPANRRHIHRFLLARDDSGRLAGFAIVRLVEFVPGVYMAVARRGPVTRTIEDLERVLPAMLGALRAGGACTLIASPRWEGAGAEQCVAVLCAHGGATMPDEEQTQHRSTGYISLAGTEAELMARFKQRGRRQIRKAEKMGLKIREATPADIAAYDTIWRDFNRLKGLDISGQPTVEAQARLAAQGGVFLVAELDGKMIGGHVVVRDGSRAFWLSLASIETEAALPKNYLLLWEAMRLMQARGCTYYDMAGYTAAEGDREGEDEGAANRDQFKAAFNPIVVPLVPMMLFALKPAQHALLYRARGAYRQLKRGMRK